MPLCFSVAMLFLRYISILIQVLLLLLNLEVAYDNW